VFLDAVPFDFPSPQIPFVVTGGEIEGVRGPLRVLFDTGNATPFVVVIGERSPAAAAARRTGGPPLVFHATAGGSPASFAPARLKRFRLGGLEVTDATAGLSAAIDGVAAQLPGGLDAVVGQALVRDRIVRVDYRTRRIDFDAQPGAARKAIPMQLTPLHPLSVIDVRINGRGPFRMAIDTAAGGTLLSPAAARRAGVPETGPEVRLGGAGGTASTGRVATATLTAGGAAWTKAQVVVTDIVGPVAKEAGAPVDGIFGANLLVDRAITLDYPGGRVWIEPVA
jgi:hypothetical protein